MTQTEDTWQVVGDDGRHPVRPGDEHVQFTINRITHRMTAMQAVDLGNALVLAGSRATSAPHNGHGHHWSDDYPGRQGDPLMYVTPTSAGSATGTLLTWTPAADVTGIALDGRRSVWVLLHNDSPDDVTATFIVPGVLWNGQDHPDTPVVVPAGKAMVVPVRAERYDGTQVDVVWSATTGVRVSVVAG